LTAIRDLPADFEGAGLELDFCCIAALDAAASTGLCVLHLSLHAALDVDKPLGGWVADAALMCPFLPAGMAAPRKWQRSS
jgi:hypothetical protein